MSERDGDGLELSEQRAEMLRELERLLEDLRGLCQALGSLDEKLGEVLGQARGDEEEAASPSGYLH